jgi:hypothetical protein
LFCSLCLGAATTIERRKRSQPMSPGAASDNEPCVWLLAEGAIRYLQASAAEGPDLRNLYQCLVRSARLAGDRAVSHERSRPADLSRRHRLCSRHAGSYPSHCCGCFSRRALLAYGHRCRTAVTRRERSHAPGVNLERDRSVAGRPRNDTIRLGGTPRSDCLRASR